LKRRRRRRPHTQDQEHEAVSVLFWRTGGRREGRGPAPHLCTSLFDGAVGAARAPAWRRGGRGRDRAGVALAATRVAQEISRRALDPLGRESAGTAQAHSRHIEHPGARAATALQTSSACAAGSSSRVCAHTTHSPLHHTPTPTMAGLVVAEGFSERGHTRATIREGQGGGGRGGGAGHGRLRVGTAERRRAPPPRHRHLLKTNL
jgi:hypothetical protein